MAGLPKRDIRLSEEHIKALTKLATDMNGLASTGPTARQPSWRVFVRRIAEGVLTVQPTGADKNDYVTLIKARARGSKKTILVKALGIIYEPSGDV